MTFEELVESYGGREMSGPDDRRPKEVFSFERGSKRWFAWPSQEQRGRFCMDMELHMETIFGEFPEGCCMDGA
jgi:hypothetical protein